jgi:hypothetical protein
MVLFRPNEINSMPTDTWHEMRLMPYVKQFPDTLWYIQKMDKIDALLYSRR